MKLSQIGRLFLGVMVFVGSAAFAEVSCEYRSSDLPRPIVGHGSSKAEAMGDAIEKCFDARVEMFERIRKTVVDMDRGQDFIDSCANIQCSYKTAKR